MKTLIIYELVPEETKFFVVKGDRAELDGLFVNSIGAEKFSKSLREEVATADWGAPLKTPLLVAEHGITRIVHCGFIL